MSEQTLYGLFAEAHPYVYFLGDFLANNYLFFLFVFTILWIGLIFYHHANKTHLPENTTKVKDFFTFKLPFSVGVLIAIMMVINVPNLVHIEHQYDKFIKVYASENQEVLENVEVVSIKEARGEVTVDYSYEDRTGTVTVEKELTEEESVSFYGFHYVKGGEVIIVGTKVSGSEEAFDNLKE